MRNAELQRNAFGYFPAKWSTSGHSLFLILHLYICRDEQWKRVHSEYLSSFISSYINVKQFHLHPCYSQKKSFIFHTETRIILVACFHLNFIPLQQSLPIADTWFHRLLVTKSDWYVMNFGESCPPWCWACPLPWGTTVKCLALATCWCLQQIQSSVCIIGLDNQWTLNTWPLWSISFQRTL